MQAVTTIGLDIATHGTKQTCRNVWFWAAFGGKTDIQRIAPNELRPRTPTLCA
jgi:hypothetical protein